MSHFARDLRPARYAREGAATLALRWAAVALAVGLLVHTVDHLRRGLDAVTTEVFWAGNVSTVLALVAITLVFASHRRAAQLAVVVGVSQALGVAAVHLLPAWGVLSDSLRDGGVDAVSWVAVLAEIAGAAAFGVAGLFVLTQPRTVRGTRRAE